MLRLVFSSNHHRLEVLGAILWPSFLWAGIASMVFFSAFDPIDLGSVATFTTDVSRLAGYTIGFLGFWALGISTTICSVFLLKIIDITGDKESTQDTDAQETLK